MKLQTQLFVGNEFIDSRSGECHSLKNPVDDSVVTEKVQYAGSADIDEAVSKARHAFSEGPWSTYTGGQRASCMLRFADLAEQHAANLAKVESLPTGRPVAGVQFFDIAHMVEVYRYYAGWADKIAGESYNDDDGTYKIVQYEPLGVCAGVASWNATFLYVAWKIAPALAAGNTFIFKPSEKSPFGALALGPLFAEAGFPPGVVQFVNGAGECGIALASHPHIAKISFTGSAAVGRKIQDAATQSNFKRVTLELGGKSPALVFPDAPMDVALQSVGRGFLANSGQVCAAGSRAFVHESVAESFIAGLKKIFEQASQGLGASPLELSTEYGPVVDHKQFENIMRYISIGKETATLVTGGQRKGSRGCFIEPTIFRNPASDSAILHEEIFGPVLTVNTFRTEDEVVTMANDTTYGLSATLYTTDITRALRVSRRLDSGAICINTPHLPNKNTPFGGKKQSGTGRELGKHGLLAYLDPKTIHINMRISSHL